MARDSHLAHHGSVRDSRLMAQSLGLGLSLSWIGAGLQARLISIWTRLGDELEARLHSRLGMTNVGLTLGSIIGARLIT